MTWLKTFFRRIFGNRIDIEKYNEGYNWAPCTPYNVSEAQKRKQGLHHALGLHYPSRDGSWVFGYDYVCGGCGMYIGPWSEKRLQATTDEINKLPPEKQQQAAAFYSGGR